MLYTTDILKGFVVYYRTDNMFGTSCTISI